MRRMINSRKPKKRPATGRTTQGHEVPELRDEHDTRTTTRRCTAGFALPPEDDFDFLPQQEAATDWLEYVHRMRLESP